MSKRMSRRALLRLVGAGVSAAVLSACTPQVVKETVVVEKEKIVKETVVVQEVVKETIIVEGEPKEVTKVVEKVVEKEVEKVITATPAPEAPKLITYVESAGFGVPQYRETIAPIAKELSRKMQSEGVNIEFRVLVLDDPRLEYPLLYASGVEFTFAFDAQWYNMLSLREQGYFRPLETLLPQFPHIVEAIGQDVIDYNFMFEHLYGLPTGFYLGQTSGVVYRLDLVEKYGMDKPTCLDDLEEFFKEVKKNEPEMIPYGADKTFNAFGVPARWHWYERKTHPYGRGGEVSGATLLGVLDGKPHYVDSETTDSYKACAERARLWYENDWVNKNILQIMGATLQEELFNPGKCAVMGYNEPSIKAEQQVQPALQAYVPEGKAAGLDTTGQREGSYIDWARFKQWNFQCFNANMALEDTLAGLQFFDWLLSDQDNIDIWLLGIDGVNYKKLPNMRFAEIPGTDGATNYRRRWYVAGVPGQFERVPESASEDYLADLAYLTDTANFMPNPIELWEAERKPIEAELAQLTASSDEYQLPISAGMLPLDEAIPALTKGLDAANRQLCKATYQEQMDTWIAEHRESFDANLKKAQDAFANWEKTTYAEFKKSQK